MLYVAVLAGLVYPLAVALAGFGAAGAIILAAVGTFYFALFALATIAVYLARTYKNGVARPVFVVDRTKTHL